MQGARQISSLRYEVCQICTTSLPDRIHPADVKRNQTLVVVLLSAEGRSVTRIASPPGRPQPNRLGLLQKESAHGSIRECLVAASRKKARLVVLSATTTSFSAGIIRQSKLPAKIHSTDPTTPLHSAYARSLETSVIKVLTNQARYVRVHKAARMREHKDRFPLL